MGKIVETEYETVKKPVTRYECDACGIIGDKEDFASVAIADTVIEGSYVRSPTVGVLCGKCSGAEAAAQIEAHNAKKKSLAEYMRVPAIVGTSLIIASACLLASFSVGFTMFDSTPIGVALVLAPTFGIFGGLLTMAFFKKVAQYFVDM